MSSMERAGKLLAASRTEEAYKEILRIEKDAEAFCEKDLLFLKARVLSEWDKKNLALSVYREINQRFPLCREGWEKSLSLYTQMGLKEGSMLAASSLLDISPEHPRALKVVFEQRMAENDFEKALDIARQKVGSAPSHAVGWLYLAISSWHIGSDNIAEASLERSLFLNPRYAQAWLFRAKMKLEHGENEEAVSALKKAMEINKGLCFKKMKEDSKLARIYGQITV